MSLIDDARLTDEEMVAMRAAQAPPFNDFPF